MLALRMAWREAKRHRLRTLLAVLLLALPLIAGLSLTITIATHEDVATARQRALPTGVEAVIETYPLPPERLPLKQHYHASDLVLYDSDLVGADQQQVEAALMAPVLEAFESSNLLLHSGEGFTVASLTEADAAMEFLAPQANAFLAAVNHHADTLMPAVVSEGVADRLHIGVGDSLQVVSASGFEDQEIVSASYRVAGIVPGAQAHLYTRFGKLQQAREGKPGVVRLFFTPEKVTWSQVKDLNKIGALVVSREVLSHPPSPSQMYPVHRPLEKVMLDAALVGLAGAVALLLALFLLSPAFTVVAEQHTRSLALLSVVGAEPKQLRRIMAAHGLVLGLVAGGLAAVCGTALGVVLLWLRLRALAAAEGITGPAVELKYNLQFVPWLLTPLTMLLGVLAGYLAAYLPAHWAAKQDLLVSLSGRSFARRRPPRLRLASVLLVLAALAWALLFTLPHAFLGGEGDWGTYLAFSALTVLATLLNVFAAMALLPFIFRLLQRVRLPLLLRLAARDVYQHRRRSFPTAAAITVLVLAVTASFSIAATQESNRTDIEIVSRGEQAVVLAPRVYSQWDDDLLQQGITALGLPVKQAVPVWNISRGGINLEPREQCPAGRDVNIEARLQSEAPIECVPYYVPQYLTNMLDTPLSLLVMDAAALRASHLPISAQVLDAGGMIVGDASVIDNGKAQVTVLDEGGKPVRSAQIQADFLPNVLPILSPQAAKSLGLAPADQIGVFLEFERPVSPEEFEQAWNNLGDLSALLVHDGPGYRNGQQPEMIVASAVAVFIVLILWLTLSLARTTMRADVATLNSLGASPGLARRYSAAQALIVTLAAAPLGAFAGVGVAYASTLLNRAFPTESGGPFRLFVVPVWVPLAALVTIAVASLLGWLAGGMRTEFSTRRME